MGIGRALVATMSTLLGGTSAIDVACPNRAVVGVVGMMHHHLPPLACRAHLGCLAVTVVVAVTVAVVTVAVVIAVLAVIAVVIVLVYKLLHRVP